MKYQDPEAKVKLKFQTKKGEQVLVKVGLSAVGYEGSTKNLNLEVTGWDFNYVSEAASDAWEENLSQIHVETKDVAEKRTFYTALYHSLFTPEYIPTWTELTGAWIRKSIIPIAQTIPYFHCGIPIGPFIPFSQF